MQIGIMQLGARVVLYMQLFSRSFMFVCLLLVEWLKLRACLTVKYNSY